MPGNVYTADYLVEIKPAGTWNTIADASIIEASGSTESGQSDQGAGFGDEALTSASVTVKRSAAGAPSTYARLPIRITFTVGANTAKAFVGEVASWSGDLDTVTWDCESMLAALPGRTRDYYSPIRFRRPPATKTTASSVEDPTNGAYVGGLINEILWAAGGRPNAQSGTYPTADFYYDCEQAIRAPDWSWVAGENGYEEAKRLARAVGGQLYQKGDGVVYYKQPLTMIGSVAATYTTASFKELDEQGSAQDQYALTFNCSFTPRRIQPIQEIISDTTPRIVAAGAAVTIDLEPQWPLYSVVLDGGTLKEKNITATRFDGTLMAYHASTGYTVVTTVKAMRITAVVTNNSAWAMQITKIVISGQPIAAGETGTVTAGSGDPARALEDNIFVQTKAHATALATMALSFYGTARATRTLSEMVYDPLRVVGDTVALTVSELSLSAVSHIILRKEHEEAGAVMNLTLLDATGLPALADYWLCQSTSQSGTKKVAW